MSKVQLRSERGWRAWGSGFGAKRVLLKCDNCRQLFSRRSAVERWHDSLGCVRDFCTAACMRAFRAREGFPERRQQ